MQLSDRAIIFNGEMKPYVDLSGRLCTAVRLPQSFAFLNQIEIACAPKPPYAHQ